MATKCAEFYLIKMINSLEEASLIGERQIKEGYYSVLVNDRTLQAMQEVGNKFRIRIEILQKPGEKYRHADVYEGKVTEDEVPEDHYYVKVGYGLNFSRLPEFNQEVADKLASQKP